MPGATHFRMKSTSPDSIQHSRTRGSARTNSSNARKSASAWPDRGTEANHETAEPRRPAAVAQNVALFLQRPHPAQAGRRRNADAFGQFDIGDSAIGLDFGEDFEVDFVKILRHAGPVPWARGAWQTLPA